VWIPSHTRALTVQADRTLTGATVTERELAGVARTDWNIAREIAKPVSQEQWRALTDAIEASSFWTRRSAISRDVNDGTSWILEGRRNNGYYVVEETNPVEGPFRRACLILFDLAGASGTDTPH
jgi:hypothetical protein